MDVRQQFQETNFFYNCDVNNPQFESAQKVHDWRNYIPSNFREIWFDLSEETRMVIAIFAEWRADSEDWE